MPGLNIAAAYPARGWIIDINTGEQHGFPMNPSQLEESIQVNWKKQGVIGMSHPILQYQHTDAHTLPGVEFYVDRHQMSKERGEAVSLFDFLEFKRFLQSLTVPPGQAQNIAGGSPSRVLFFWPDVVSLQCVVGNVSTRTERFAYDGSPMTYTARVGFMEIRDYRMSSEVVLYDGSLRE